MSIYTAKTGISSILKSYSPVEREKIKTAVINKVRFEIPKEQGITNVLEGVLNYNNFVQYNDFISFLKESPISDNDFLRLISEARRSIHLLQPQFSVLVETILSLNWKGRDKRCIDEFTEFYVDLLVAHNKYTSFAISKLIANWVPANEDASEWVNACPSESVTNHLEVVHKLIARLLNVIPMTYDVVIEAIEAHFPYYKKPSFVVGAYVHNMLWLLEYKALFSSYIIELLFRKLLILDVNAPRNEIEDAEFEEEDIEDEAMFAMDGCSGDDQAMSHPIAETLDICMEKMFIFLQRFNKPTIVSKKAADCTEVTNFFKVLFTAFDNVLLPSHNTHHVQFLMLYSCSFKDFLAERFLSNLWSKVTNPNASAPIRQASVGYIASFLARAKFIPIYMLKSYIAELCSWAHQYRQRSDSVKSNNSLRANIVFFSVCQAIFYVIAFRSRDLTHNKQGLLFLQSLQLSALVTSNLNPLRVCLPAVATAFAGVTRAYQLAYCHTILERNARRKLATEYANETATPEECLETFFPFDPYLLKKSGKSIKPIYLQYQASDIEEDSHHIETGSRRKRGDSEVADDIDDFIIDKKQKFSELSRSHEKDMQFTYGLSPGFHI